MTPELSGTQPSCLLAGTLDASTLGAAGGFGADDVANGADGHDKDASGDDECRRRELRTAAPGNRGRAAENCGDGVGGETSSGASLCAKRADEPPAEPPPRPCTPSPLGVTDASGRSATIAADVLGPCRRGACGCRRFDYLADGPRAGDPSLCGCGHRADDHALVAPTTPDERTHVELDKLLAPARSARRRRDYQVTPSGYRSQVVHPAEPSRRIDVTASSREELFARVAWLRELRRDVKIGKRSPLEVARLVERGRQRPLTVKDAWDEWLLTQSPHDRRKAGSILEQQITPCLSPGALDLGLWTLTETVMRGLELAMLGRGYAPKTVKGAVACLAAAVSLAVRTHHLEAKPWGSWTPLPAAVRKEREAARDPGELEAIVREARKLDEEKWSRGELGDLSYRVLVLALCALRNGEGAGLGWDDVDLDRRSLVVRHQALDSWTKDYPSWTRPLCPVKGRKKTHHVVALHPDAMRALVAQRAQLAALGIFAPDGPVFPAKERHELTGWWRRNANCIRPDAFKRLVVRAKLPHPERWCVHSLRHSSATLEIGAGADPKSVQARTGHASLDQLEQYVHTRTRGLVPSKIPELAIAAPPAHAPPHEPPPAIAGRQDLPASELHDDEEARAHARRRGTSLEVAARKRAGARAYSRAVRAGLSKDEARAAAQRAYQASRAAQARRTREGKERGP